MTEERKGGQEGRREEDVEPEDQSRGEEPPHQRRPFKKRGRGRVDTKPKRKVL